MMLKNNNIQRYFFALIAGGALGNFYDRIVYTAVPDFIDLHFMDFHWFVFNVADIFITIRSFLPYFSRTFANNKKQMKKTNSLIASFLIIFFIHAVAKLSKMV